MKSKSKSKRNSFPSPMIQTDSFRKQYVPALARFPNDPMAVVDCYSDVKRIAAQRGLRIEGAPRCEVDYLETHEPQPYRPAWDVIEREVARIIDRDYGGKISNLSKKKLDDVIQETTERLSGAQD